jgi:hypothetical protein
MNTLTHAGLDHDPTPADTLDLAFIPVGATHRAPLGDCLPPPEVRTADDLPSRLLLGDLDRERFRADPSGWSVRYRDADPETYVDLRFDAKTRLLVFTQVWRGLAGPEVWARGEDWSEAARTACLRFPQIWDARAAWRLETRYNLRYLAGSVGRSRIVGLPDGDFREVVVPIPLRRLPQLALALATLEVDRTVAAVVTVFATLVQQQVDYVEGRCPELPTDPEALARRSREAVGLPCHELPGWQQTPGGPLTLSVRRWVYLAHVGCAFRDLLRVLGHLHHFGLVGDAEWDCDAHPRGLEWRALVLPAGLSAEGGRPQLFDEGPTRRVAYGRLTAPEDLAALRGLREVSLEQALARMQAAALWAERQPDVLEDLGAEPTALRPPH